MELIEYYNKLHKLDRLHYITMESVINKVLSSYKKTPKDPHNKYKMVSDLTEEMHSRGLNKYFQVELNIENGLKLNVKVHEINRYNPPRECVVWS
jgi:hypothetical protein